MTKSVILKPDSSWSIYVGDKEVPKACSILSQFSSPLSSNSELSSLIKDIDQATICPGNPEEKFITICHMHGGRIKAAWGNRDTIAFVDNSPVVDSTGKGYSCTVRRVDCNVICEHTGQYPQHCKACQTFRSTLRASVSRQKGDSHDHTSADSHTRYCLPPVDLISCTLVDNLYLLTWSYTWGILFIMIWVMPRVIITSCVTWLRRPLLNCVRPVLPPHQSCYSDLSVSDLLSSPLWFSTLVTFLSCLYNIEVAFNIASEFVRARMCSARIAGWHMLVRLDVPFKSTKKNTCKPSQTLMQWLRH